MTVLIGLCVLLAQVQLNLKDQHGNTKDVTTKADWVLFMSDMPSFKWVKDEMQKLGWKQDDLDARHLAIVADISKMPPVIRRFVAIPRLRQLPYEIFLDEQGEQIPSQWPRVSESVVLLKRDEQRGWVVQRQLKSSQAVHDLLHRWLPQKDPPSL